MRLRAGGLVASLLVLGPPLSIAHAPSPGPPSFLPEATLQALASEVSGETAKRQLEFLTRQHRMRGSRQYRAAADHIVQELQRYGLTDARVLSLPADGKIFYGTQRSRPAWDAEFAELWELRRVGEAFVRAVRIASFDAMPITLAQDSASGEATADLVDVGAGTLESDYQGRDVRGKLVLTSSQPSSMAKLAVERFGAAGIVSYVQNQKTAWYGENETLVRWGHLDTFATTPTFGFMVSLQQARAWQARLRAGDTVRLEAVVKAGQHAGSYDIAEATIAGAEGALRNEEIVFSCHLDHPRPGANDNASGCSAILEAARALQALIADGRIPRPARTLRFIWPPEIEGTLALLNARPEQAARTRAAIHMDMVGGGPETKAVFHVARGPLSLPSFVHDVVEVLTERVNLETANYAAGRGGVTLPLHAPEGGKEPLRAVLAPFSLGSDHQVWADTSFSVPAIYLHDWPDRYIHTSRDLPANIDPTKLKRAAFLGAAYALALADLRPSDAPRLHRLHEARALGRAARVREQQAGLSSDEAAVAARFQRAYEQAVSASIGRFVGVGGVSDGSGREGAGAPSQGVGQAAASASEASLNRMLDAALGVSTSAPRATGEGALVYRRNPDLRGTASGFGHDYFAEKLGEERSGALVLPKHVGLRGGGDAYAYDALNLVDGRRTIADIRDALSASHGPVPLPAVASFLAALESAGLVRR